MHYYVLRVACRTARWVTEKSNQIADPENTLPVARFSKVPIINGPGKPSPFILKIEVSKVLHLA